MSVALTKADLRKHLRAKRRALTGEDLHRAARSLVQVIRPKLSIKKTRRVAVYLAQDGEIDLQPFIQRCWQQGFEVYLPVLHRFKPTLWFARYQRDSKLVNNRFAIPEPLSGEPIKAWQLDTVLLPLVGFDEQGGRLGMGGGFYDRTFAGAAHWPKQPKLYGVAHECQKVTSIPLESWDIKLNGIFTDQCAYAVSKHNA